MNFFRNSRHALDIVLMALFAGLIIRGKGKLVGIVWRTKAKLSRYSSAVAHRQTGRTLRYSPSGLQRRPSGYGKFSTNRESEEVQRFFGFNGAVERGILRGV